MGQLIMALAGLITLSGNTVSAVPLTPPGKWVLNYAPTHCTLWRDRSGDSPGIVVQTRPLTEEHDLLILLPPAGKPGRYIEGKLLFGSKEGERRWIAVRDSGNRGHRVIDTSITNEELAWAGAAGTVRIVAVSPNEKLDLSVPLPSMTKAVAALEPCEADLVKRWGVDVTWEVPAKPASDVRKLFTSSDYPNSALEQNQTGDVRVLMSVDEHGRVGECRVIESSQVASLDKATCSVLRRRARFAPGLDAAGKPVGSKLLSPRVRFMIAS
jgi:TonB family protein